MWRLVLAAIMADSGIAEPVRSALQYSVWCDFSPEEALVDGRDTSLRANLLVLCKAEVASRLHEAITAWKSQERIIKGLVEARKARLHGGYSMEAYIKFDPRPALDYRPYAEYLRSKFGGEL